MKILIIKPSALGDIVMALPAVAVLRQAYADAEIDWLVRPEFADLLRRNPHLHKIVEFDRKKLGRALWSWDSAKALGRFLAGLRKGRYDLVVDLQGLLRTGFFAFVTGARQRVGMADAREGGRIFYNEKVKRPSESLHMVDYYLAVARQAANLGMVTSEAQFDISTDEGARQSVQAKLVAEGIGDKEYCVLIPGSAHEAKCWPVERFAAVGQRLADAKGLDVVVVGSAGEREKGKRVVSTVGSKAVNFCGLTSVAELVEMLRGAELVISNDTGPGHIAMALGRALVMVMGPSNPARVGPYGGRGVAVAPQADARGLEFKSDDPRFEIGKVTVEEVVGAALGQLGERAD